MKKYQFLTFMFSEYLKSKEEFDDFYKFPIAADDKDRLDGIYEGKKEKLELVEGMLERYLNENLK